MREEGTYGILAMLVLSKTGRRGRTEAGGVDEPLVEENGRVGKEDPIPTPSAISQHHN